MSLRQIIRNQKLSNFDYKLADFISEADEEVKYIDKEGNTKTMAVAPALRLQDPKHPARIAAEKLRASKETPDKKAAVDDEEVKVDIDDETREKIDDFGEELGLSISDEEEDSFADEDGNVLITIGSDGTLLPGHDIEDLSPEEEKALETSIDDFNDSTGVAAKVTDFFNGDDEEEKEDDDAAVDAERDAEERDAPEVTEGPMDNEQIKEELDYIQDVTGKDKKLESDANPKESSEWTDTDIDPTPDNFSKWQRKSKRDRPADQKIDMSDAIVGVEQPYGFPEKYVEVLERMINTEGMSDPKKDSVSNFIDGAGAGMISSQAGEILTMMVTSIPNDEQAQAFANKIGEVLEKQEGNQILDKSWVKAAMENRASTMDHVRATYGPDAKITSGCWDLESEVEAMGLPDYKKNKGYSTDAYFTVETPNHPEGDLLLEVSLKKDAKVMFYNGGTGDILKPKCVSGAGDPKGCAPMGWGLNEEDFEDVEHDGVTLDGDSYNPAEFQRAQNRVYRENIAALTNPKEMKHSVEAALAKAAAFESGESKRKTDVNDRDDLINTLNNKTFNSIRGDVEITADNLATEGPKLMKAVLGTYEDQFDENGNKVKSSPSFATDRINKLAMLIGKNGKEWGGRGPAPDNNVRAVYDRMSDEHVQYQENLAKGLLMNPKLRAGLMGILRDEFPIKAAATGEEIMSIGDMVLDRKTCNSLFGTSNFNDIKERLSIDKDDKGNPIITYSAQGAGTPIPLANVDIRQKGKGYSGYPSFNMKVHPGFAKALKGSQSALQDGYVPLMNNVIIEIENNTLAHHWKIAEDNYPLYHFIRELNEGSLN